MTDPQIDTPDSEAARRQRLIGIALMMAAVTCFSCLDATGKYLSRELPVLEIVWGRYVTAFFLALIPSNPITRPGVMVTKRPVLQVVRSTLLVASTLFGFMGLRYLQLDQHVSILFTTPLIVAALSGPLLGEWIDRRRWIAIAVGFAGIVVVMRPGFGGINPAALFTCGAVACYVFYVISTRVLARSDSNETTLFYSNLVGAVLTSLIVPFVWQTPAGIQPLMLLLLLGVLGSVGHFLLIVTFRLAPPAIVSPFTYMQIGWMIALGYFIFGDLPSVWTLAGVAIVIASGLYLLHLETRQRVRVVA